MCSNDVFTCAYVARIITFITVKHSVDGLACTTVTVTVTTQSLSNVTRRLEFRRQIKSAEQRSKTNATALAYTTTSSHNKPWFHFSLSDVPKCAFKKDGTE